MNILITGGAGFIGAALAFKLKKKYPKYRITVFDNLKRRGSEINLTGFKTQGIEFIHGDIRNMEDLNQVGNFDFMIEASAEPSVLAGLDTSPAYVINNNLIGSINCFNLCLEKNAKIVFLSSSRVYPIKTIENANYVEEKTRFSLTNNQEIEGITKKGISEKLSLEGARSFYGTTKLCSEYLLKEYAEFYGLKSAITRFGVIAGPGQFGKTDQGIISLWLASHFFNTELKYIGYGGLGKQVRDILHINDLFNLVDKQIHEMNLFINNIYNVGGGIENSVSLLELTNLCRELTQNQIRITSEIATRPADLRIYITDNTKITSEIGWSPKIGVEELLQDLLDWIRENEYVLKNYFS